MRLNARRAIPRTLISFKKPSPNDIRAADRDHLFIKKILASPPYHVTNQLTQESHWCLEAQWHGIDGTYDEPIPMLIEQGGYCFVYHLLLQ